MKSSYTEYVEIKVVYAISIQAINKDIMIIAHEIHKEEDDIMVAMPCFAPEELDCS